MKEIRQEQDEIMRIQLELDSMAAEVPEMPEEFRQGWRKAIREDAARRSVQEKVPKETESGVKTNRTVPIRDLSEADTRGTEREASARPTSFLSSRRRTGILSAVAAMIFLIGGTLATRNTLSPRLQREQTVMISGAGLSGDAEMQAMETAFPVSGEIMSSKEITMEVVPKEMGKADDELPPEEIETTGISERDPDAANEMLQAKQAVPADSGKAAPTLGAEAPDENESELEEAAEESEDASVVEDSEEEPANSTNDAVGSDEEEMTDFRKEAEFFLEDMGAFLRAALPYLIGIAAILAVIRLLRKHRRK